MTGNDKAGARIASVWIRCRTIVEYFFTFSIHMGIHAGEQRSTHGNKEKNEDIIFNIRTELAWSIRFLLQE